MPTVTAVHLGETAHIYGGNIVEFEVDDETVFGTLTEADAPKGSIYAHITVDDRTWTVTKMTQVRVDV